MAGSGTNRPSSVSPGRPGSSIYPTNPLGDKFEGIATGRDVEWEPLVDFRRLDVSENTIHGAISWAHGSEIVHSFGGNVLVYGRSMMKPLLMKAFADQLGAESDCLFVAQWRYRARSRRTVSALGVGVGINAVPSRRSANPIWKAGKTTT